MFGVQSVAQVAVGDHDSLLVIQRAGDHTAPSGLDNRRAAAADTYLSAGSGTQFKLKVGGGEQLHRLLERARERHYFEVPLPVGSTTPRRAVDSVS
jgi:hypothetical protein